MPDNTEVTPNKSTEVLLDPALSVHQLKIHSIPEEYKIAIDRQEKESDRFWARSNVMLLVQGALISFYIGLEGKGTLFGLITTLEGVILALIWMAVLGKGKSYVSRWDAVIRNIEGQAIASQELQFPLSKIYKGAKDSERAFLLPVLRRSTTKLMQYAVFSILAFWVSALALTLTVGVDAASFLKVEKMDSPSSVDDPKVTETLGTVKLTGDSASTERDEKTNSRAVESIDDKAEVQPRAE